LTWLSCRVAGLKPCVNQTLVKKTDNFHYYIRITIQFLCFRIFQPKLKIMSRRYPLLFVHYTNCIKWRSGVDGFFFSSAACSLSLRQGVQTGAGNHRAYPTRAVNPFLGVYLKTTNCIDPYNHLCIKNINTVCTRARNLSLSWATRIQFTHSHSLFFTIMWVCQKVRTLKRSLPLRVSTKIM